MKKMWKFWKETSKSAQKLGIHENKQTEYTKKLMKEILIRKCTEVGNKYNSMIRTIGKDQAWQDMQHENQIPSWQYKWVRIQESI